MEIIRSREHSAIQKVITIIRLLNNFMNTEEFFYLDLIVTLILSLYSFFITRKITTPQYYYESLDITSPSIKNPNYPYIPEGVQFYIYGNLIVNVLFFWYFSYCRYLNGKDIITLRRSIQLLSHGFQLSSIGLLVLCSEGSNQISDSEYAACLENNACNAPVSPSKIYREVIFYCTPQIWSTYTIRIILNSSILFKTLVDEYLSNFVISRGTIIDVAMILFIPVGSLFSYLTEYHADNFMRDMRRILSVTYEVNDISRVFVDGYYDRLTDSHHSKEVSVLIFSILMGTGDGLFLFYFRALLFLPMVEYFVCCQSKFGMLVLVLAASICISICGTIVDIVNSYYFRELYAPYTFSPLLALLVLALFLVLHQCRRSVSLQSAVSEVARAFLFVGYTVLYCPLHPAASFFVGKGRDVTYRRSTAAESVKRIDETEYQERVPRGLCLTTLIQVPILILLSPISNYHLEDVRIDLQLSVPRLEFLSAPYEGLKTSSHKPHYNVVIWALALLTIFNIAKLSTFNRKYAYVYLDDDARKAVFLRVDDILVVYQSCLLGAYLCLMVESFTFKHNKYGSMLVTLMLTTSSALAVYIYQLVLGLYGFLELDFLRSSFVLNLTLLVLVAYQNKAQFSLSSVVLEFILFWYYTLRFPFRVVWHICGKGRDSLSSKDSSSNSGSSSGGVSCSISTQEIA